MFSRLAFSVGSLTIMSLPLRDGMLEDFADEIKCLSVFHQYLDDS